MNRNKKDNFFQDEMSKVLIESSFGQDPEQILAELEHQRDTFLHTQKIRLTHQNAIAPIDVSVDQKIKNKERAHLNDNNKMPAQEENKQNTKKSFLENVINLVNTFDDDVVDNKSDSTKQIDTPKTVILSNFGITYQMQCTKSDLNIQEGNIYSSLGLQTKRTNEQYNYAQLETEKLLKQVPNSTLILNARKGESSCDTIIEIFDKLSFEREINRYKSIRSQQTKCSTLRMSLNSKRGLVAGLPHNGLYMYQLFDLSLKFRRKSPWNAIQKTLIYDVDFHDDGLRIASLDNMSMIRISNVDTDSLEYCSLPSLYYIPKGSFARWTRDIVNKDQLVLLKTMHNHFRIFDVAKEDFIDSFTCKDEKLITHLDVSHDGKIAFAKNDRSINLYDCRTGDSNLISKNTTFFMQEYDEWCLDGLNWNQKNSNQVMMHIANDIRIFDLRMLYSCYEIVIQDEVQAACFM